MERVAFCSFDRPLLSTWIGLHTKLDAAARAAGGRADLSLATALLWARLLVGELAGLDEEAKTVLTDAPPRLEDGVCELRGADIRRIFHAKGEQEGGEASRRLGCGRSPRRALHARRAGAIVL